MSNKKFFSHGLEQSAIDVIYKKKGHELLRYYNGSIHGSFMKSFPSYEQFILLLRTFYFSPQVKPYNIQVPLSLRNANSTFILYNNINDIVSIINLIDEKDIKDIKKVLELLSFINFINIFNIVTFLELYDITENLDLINKKLLLYKKYVRLYKKDCFIINYI